MQDLTRNFADIVGAALFGNVTQKGGLVESLHVGSNIAGRNPLYDMRTVLSKLGVTATPVRGHHNHYHIYLRPPQAYNRENLEATSIANSAADAYSQPPSVNSDKELIMLFDLTNVPLPPPITNAQYTYVTQAEVNPTPFSTEVKFDRVYEGCLPVETQILPGASGLVPGDALRLHWQNYPKQKIGNGDLSQAKVSVLEQPKFGTLKPIQPKVGDSLNESGPAYFYDVKPGTPNGTEDRIVFLMEIAGKRLKVVERLIMVWNSTPESTDCNGKDFYVRRISQVLSSPDQNFADATSDGVPVYAIPNAHSLLAAGYYSGIRYSFTDLPYTALGQTGGEGASATITLDTNAAGHGWYTDPTPLDSSDDYLPTSSSAVWQAKAGSAAAGKMDLLSVLLHEETTEKQSGSDSN